MSGKSDLQFTIYQETITSTGKQLSETLWNVQQLVLSIRNSFFLQPFFIYRISSSHPSLECQSNEQRNYSSSGLHYNEQKLCKDWHHYTKGNQKISKRASGPTQGRRPIDVQGRRCREWRFYSRKSSTAI